MSIQQNQGDDESTEDAMDEEVKRRKLDKEREIIEREEEEERQRQEEEEKERQYNALENFEKGLNEHDYKAASMWLRGIAEKEKNRIGELLANIPRFNVGNDAMRLAIIYDEHWGTGGSAFVHLAKELVLKIKGEDDRGETLHSQKMLVNIVQNYEPKWVFALFHNVQLLFFNGNKTLLHYVIERYDHSSNSLRINDPKKNTTRGDMIYAYLRHQNIAAEEMQQLLARDLSTPLIYAIHRRLIFGEIKVLLETDAETGQKIVDLQDKPRENTALMYAVKYGRVALVEYLLRNYRSVIDFSKKNLNKDTAFIMAAESGSYATVENLVNALDLRLKTLRETRGYSPEQTEEEKRRILDLRGFRQLTAYNVVKQNWIEGREKEKALKLLNF